MLCSDGSFVSAHGSLTPAEVELTQRQFLEFDVDGDQSISRRDFGEAMGRNDPQWREPQRQAKLDAMYAAVDRDGDGRVSFVDFAAMRVRKKRGVATPRGVPQASPQGLPHPSPPAPALPAKHAPPAQTVLRVHLSGCSHGLGLTLDASNVITQLTTGGAAANPNPNPNPNSNPNPNPNANPNPNTNPTPGDSLRPGPRERCLQPNS